MAAQSSEAEFDTFYRDTARRVVHLVYGFTGDLTWPRTRPRRPTRGPGSSGPPSARTRSPWRGCAPSPGGWPSRGGARRHPGPRLRTARGPRHHRPTNRGPGGRRRSAADVVRARARGRDHALHRRPVHRPDRPRDQHPRRHRQGAPAPGPRAAAQALRHEETAMADHEDWTADDDAGRGALATLRHDVDALPLPDVRFVKARGVRRRRRALALTALPRPPPWWSGGGLGQLGRDTTLPVTPATQTPAPVPTVLPGQRHRRPARRARRPPTRHRLGACSGARNWAALGQPESADLRNHECLTRSLRGRCCAAVTLDPGGSRAADPVPGRSSTQDPVTVAGRALASDIAGCQQGQTSVTPTKGTGWPRTVLLHRGRRRVRLVRRRPGTADVTLLQVVDRLTRSRSTPRSRSRRGHDRGAALARYGTAPLRSLPTPPAGADRPPGRFPGHAGLRRRARRPRACSWPRPVGLTRP